MVNQMVGLQVLTRVEDALKDPNWTVDMQVEMKALQKNKTWNIVSLPKGNRSVG